MGERWNSVVTSLGDADPIQTLILGVVFATFGVAAATYLVVQPFTTVSEAQVGGALAASAVALVAYTGLATLEIAASVYTSYYSEGDADGESGGVATDGGAVVRLSDDAEARLANALNNESAVTINPEDVEVVEERE